MIGPYPPFRLRSLLRVKGSGQLSMNPAVLVLASSFIVQAPMPEPATLVKEIEAHQRRMDELRENYTFREVTLTDELDPKGAVNGSGSEERDVFFVNGYRIARLMRKNGKELSEGDRKGELDRIKRLIEKDTKAPSGHFYNRREENVGVSQILPLMCLAVESLPASLMLKAHTLPHILPLQANSI
jgi:hypothetical protein